MGKSVIFKKLLQNFEQRLLEKEINELYKREISKFGCPESSSGIVFKKKLKRSFSRSVLSLSCSSNSSLDEVTALQQTQSRESLQKVYTNGSNIDLSYLDESFGEARILKIRRLEKNGYVINQSEAQTNVLNITVPRSILTAGSTRCKDSVINSSLVCLRPEFLTASQNTGDKTYGKEDKNLGGIKNHPARQLSTELALPVFEAASPERHKCAMQKSPGNPGETPIELDQESTDSYESGITARDRKLSRSFLDKSRVKDTSQNLRNRSKSCKQDRKLKACTDDNKTSKSGKVQDAKKNSGLKQMLHDDNADISKNCDVERNTVSKRKRSFLRRKITDGKTLKKEDVAINNENLKDRNYVCEIHSDRKTKGLCREQSHHQQNTGKIKCTQISVLTSTEDNSDNNNKVIRKRHVYVKKWLRNLKDSSKDKPSHTAVKSQQIRDKTSVSHLHVGEIKSCQNSNQSLNSESENFFGQISLSIDKSSDKPCDANNAETDLSQQRETHATDISEMENLIPTASMRWINGDRTRLRSRHTSVVGLGSIYQRSQLQWDSIVSEFCNS